MKRFSLLCGIILAGGLPLLVSAQEVYRVRPAFCEPGFQYVPEIEYREVEQPVCKVVPNMRTKWVYCTKPGSYYCVPSCPFGHAPQDGGCSVGGVRNCQGPFLKPQLLKKKIEWQDGTRCEVEMVKERISYTVWRKVPCAPAVAAPVGTLRR